MRRLLVFTICMLGSVSISLAQHKESPAQKLLMSEYLINKFYVDSLDEHRLIEAGIKGMLSTLDPHSTYSSAEEVKEFEELMKGSFGGIGIRYQIIKDTLRVIQVIPSGPADKAGLLSGDRILAVNQDTLVGVNVSTRTAVNTLRGPKGSRLTLKILRPGIPKSFNRIITRKKISTESIQASYLITPQVGYIRLRQFSKGVSKELKKAIKTLVKAGVNGLILDLRGNSGGLLDEAIAVSNQFLKAEQRIVYTLGKEGKSSSFYASGDGLYQQGKLVVLLDAYSASASEIVAGAIQDWDRGVIIGRRSFGKGLVQRPLPLLDGSVIRLTIARYHTPSGRCIQKPYTNGLIKKKDYQEELLRRVEHGESISADSIQTIDSLRYATLLKSRPVYAGGGIIPDVFVSFSDSIYKNPLYQVTQLNGYLYQAIEGFMRMNKELIETQYTPSSFALNYSIDSSLLEQIYQLALRDDSTINKEMLLYCSPLLTRDLKALIAQIIWGEEALFKVLNQSDSDVLRALDVLANLLLN